MAYPWLRTPEATRTLDRLTAENAQLHAVIAERERREQNEQIYVKAVKAWFQRSES